MRLEGQPNFRDIGGYKTTSGKTVKRGLVFRSGELPRLTDEDVAKLERLGIRTVVNFLTEVETKSRGKDRLPDGTHEISLPIETDDGLAAAVEQARRTADFSTLPPTINPEIHRILVHDARQQYATLLREIARTDAPFVFHCSHGVHRTGAATAILLWGLGVPWQTVRKDYLLSNEFRKHEIEKRLTQLRDLAAKKQGISPQQVDMTNVNAFYILKGEYIDATRDEILKQYGSIGDYLTEGLGLTAGEIEQLRDALLE
jgi:protein-tyrosine phosphatase